MDYPHKLNQAIFEELIIDFEEYKDMTLEEFNDCAERGYLIEIRKNQPTDYYIKVNEMFDHGAYLMGRLYNENSYSEEE